MSTIEELISKALSTSDDTTPLTSVERFIIDKPCLPPKTPTDNVTNEVIYYQYLLYCEKTNLIPKSRNRFFVEFKKHFKRAHKLNEDRRYYIDSTPFEMTYEETLEMRRLRNEEKKNQKRVKLCMDGRRKQIKKSKEKKAQEKKQRLLKRKLKEKHVEITQNTQDLTDDFSQK